MWSFGTLRVDTKWRRADSTVAPLRGWRGTRPAAPLQLSVQTAWCTCSNSMSNPFSIITVSFLDYCCLIPRPLLSHSQDTIELVSFPGLICYVPLDTSKRLLKCFLSWRNNKNCSTAGCLTWTCTMKLGHSALVSNPGFPDLNWFPGTAQLSAAYSMVLKVTEIWVGHGNEARFFLLQLWRDKTAWNEKPRFKAISTHE